MINNRFIALITRIISLIISFFGLISMLGLFKGEWNWSMFMYYTIQSNVFVIVLFIFLLLKTIKDIKNNGKNGNSGYADRMEMICMVDILLTFLVFWIMLVPTLADDFNLWSFGNLSVHAITPILCIIDYILYTKSNHLKYRDVYYVLIFPIFYTILSMIAGLSGYIYYFDTNENPIRYPYFFMNIEVQGVMVLVYILVLVVFFLIISNLIYLFDKKVIKPKL